VKRYKGETLFVRLHCAEKTLHRRVELPSRRRQQKIATEKQLAFLAETIRPAKLDPLCGQPGDRQPTT